MFYYIANNDCLFFRYIETIFEENSPIDKSVEKSIAYRAIISQQTGFYLAWDYIRQNIDNIIAW